MRFPEIEPVERHEKYGSLDKRTNFSRLLITVFREPIARSVSFFFMVKRSPKMQNRTFWLYGARDDVTLADFLVYPDAVHQLKTLPSGCYDTTLEIMDKTSKIVDPNRFRHNTKAPAIANYFPLSETQFLHYSRDMNANFQCLKQLKVAYLWLWRYSAVGQTEDMTLMWKAISARAGLNIKNPETVATSKMNTAHRTATAEEKLAARRLLSTILQCDTLLWEIAGKIAYFDVNNCPLVLSQETKASR